MFIENIRGSRQLTSLGKGVVAGSTLLSVAAGVILVFLAHHGTLGEAAKQFINQKVPHFFTQVLPNAFHKKLPVWVTVAASGGTALAIGFGFAMRQLNRKLQWQNLQKELLRIETNEWD